MFQRIIVEDWAYSIPVIAFFIFFIVFIAISIRAMRLGKSERERLASLPFEKSTDNSNL
jgi:hypothetical protein